MGVHGARSNNKKVVFFTFLVPRRQVSTIYRCIRFFFDFVMYSGDAPQRDKIAVQDCSVLFYTQWQGSTIYSSIVSLTYTTCR
jgi:hypothetical protein